MRDIVGQERDCPQDSSCTLWNSGCSIQHAHGGCSMGAGIVRRPKDAVVHTNVISTRKTAHDYNANGTVRTH